MNQRPLRITKISLSDFRNYEQALIVPESQNIVLTGCNGAGKTNLLEALSLFAPGRGLRRAPFDELARNEGSGGWAAGIHIVGSETDAQLGTGMSAEELEQGNSRRIRIDGEAGRGTSAFSQYIKIVWLTPAQDRLFMGPTSDRRRYLDRLVAGSDPDHSRRLGAFEQAMRERNRLLGMSSPDPLWLSALETQMAESGAAIAAARREAAAHLNALMGKDGPGKDDDGFPYPVIAAKGQLEDWLEHHAAVEIEDKYRIMLGDSRQTDAAAGRTLQGPHRSDMEVMHGSAGMNAKLCSTGEQKALLIAMILGQTRMILRQPAGSPPVLLLDEITAHLDEARRASLFEILSAMRAQSFMTGTEEQLFAPLADKAQFFTVEDGAISGV